MVIVPKKDNMLMGSYGQELKDLISRQEVYRYEDGERIIDKRFYSECKDNFYFMNKMKHFLTKTIIKEIEPFSGSVKANFKSNSKFDLYDYQKVIKKFVLTRLKSKRRFNKILVSLDTGKGKTLTACNIYTTLNIRFTILILPKYIEKWINDVQKNIKIKREEFLVIQGSDSLEKLMRMKKKDVPRIIIFSNRTMLNALKNMEDGTYNERFKVPLWDLMKFIGSRQLLIDEAHQEFHSLYLVATVLNPKFLLGLSATFDTDERESKKHFLDMFPGIDRINPLGLDKYRNVTAVEYRVGRASDLNVTNYFTKAYCHTTFETSLMRKSQMLEGYLTMIAEIAFMKYFSQKDKNSGRLLIFANTRIMIEHIIRRLKREHPSYDIRKYMGEDPLENILDAQVCVTTLGSAGTAIDIEDLRQIIMTTSQASTNGNIQAFGRLRQIPDHIPDFTYLWSMDIGTQQNHHRTKMNLFRERTLKYSKEDYGIDLWPKFW
jgi:superfamily II DNA or RNA helicase